MRHLVTVSLSRAGPEQQQLLLLLYPPTVMELTPEHNTLYDNSPGASAGSPNGLKAGRPVLACWQWQFLLRMGLTCTWGSRSCWEAAQLQPFTRGQLCGNEQTATHMSQCLGCYHFVGYWLISLFPLLCGEPDVGAAVQSCQGS